MAVILLRRRRRVNGSAGSFAPSFGWATSDWLPWSARVGGVYPRGGSFGVFVVAVLELGPVERVAQGTLHFALLRDRKRPDPRDEVGAGHHVNVVEVGHRASRQALPRSEPHLDGDVAKGRGHLGDDDLVQKGVGGIAR
jgi:hypothetical protein